MQQAISEAAQESSPVDLIAYVAALPRKRNECLFIVSVFHCCSSICAHEMFIEGNFFSILLAIRALYLVISCAFDYMLPLSSFVQADVLHCR